VILARKVNVIPVNNGQFCSYTINVWNGCFATKERGRKSVFLRKVPVREIFIYFIKFQLSIALDVRLILRGSLGGAASCGLRLMVCCVYICYNFTYFMFRPYKVIIR
jgi:hypothetical protein